MANRTLALSLLKPEVGRAEDVEPALERGTERRVPIVRGVRRAYALATEYPRRNRIIALEHQRLRRRR
jgi:hypothetical protein